MLSLLKTPASKDITLTSSKTPYLRKINGYIELAMACCPSIYGEMLYEGFVGTPLDFNNSISASDNNYRIEVRKWLASILFMLKASAEQ